MPYDILLTHRPSGDVMLLIGKEYPVLGILMLQIRVDVQKGEHLVGISEVFDCDQAADELVAGLIVILTRQLVFFKHNRFIRSTFRPPENMLVNNGLDFNIGSLVLPRRVDAAELHHTLPAVGGA